MTLRLSLPNGWTWATFDEICEVNPRHQRNIISQSEVVTFVPMAAIDEVTGTIAKAELRKYDEVRKGYTHFAEGDVLFAKITPCMENGKAVVARNLANGIGCGTTELHVLRPLAGILPDYIFYYIRQESFRRAAAANMTGTAGQLRVPASYVRNARIPLCSIPEQARIVARIEASLRTNRIARTSIGKVPETMERFRKSVLARAFCGKFTGRNSNDEPAGKLLERIGQERRKKRGVELGVKGRNPRKYKHQEPEAVHSQRLPELPKGWVWASLDEASEYVVDCPHSTPKFQKSGKYCIDTTCIGPAEIFFESARYVSEKTFLERTHRLRPEYGDVLFSREGTIGNAVLVPQNVDICLGQRMMMFRPWSMIDSTYFMWALNSPIIKRQMDPLVTGTTSPHVNVGDIRRLGLPLAPPLEQRVIVAKINELFTRAHLIGENARTTEKNVELLEQSILTRAFRGRLISQDPNDEPASALLERIRNRQ